VTADPTAWFLIGLAVAAGVAGLALGLALVAGVGWLAWYAVTWVFEGALWRLKARRLSRAAQASGRERTQPTPTEQAAARTRRVLDGSEPIHRGAPR